MLVCIAFVLNKEYTLDTAVLWDYLHHATASLSVSQFHL